MPACWNFVSRRLGDRIEAYAECPACRNGLEFELSCTALLASASDRMPSGRLSNRTAAPGSCAGRIVGISALAIAEADPGNRRGKFCCHAASARGWGAEAMMRNEDESALLAGRLSDLDPLAEVLVDLRCRAVWRAVAGAVRYRHVFLE